MLVKLKYNELERTPKVIIQFFEQHQEEINAIDVNESLDKYVFVTLVISDYAHALVAMRSYKKALPFLNRAISLWEHSNTLEQEFPKFDMWYEAVRFDRAQANSYGKKYKQAKVDIIWLTTHYADNDLYDDWLTHAKNGVLTQIGNWIGVALLVLIFCASVSEKYSLIRIIYDGVMAVGVLCSLLICLIVWIRKKKVFKKR